VFEKWKQRGCAACAAPSGCATCAAQSEECCVPMHIFPAPKVFRADVTPPTYIRDKELPPIQLIRAVPPSVDLVAASPPELPLGRRPPPPVELFGAVPPPIPMLRLQPGPLGNAPPFQIPSVQLFRVSQPPGPACPPPVGGPCCTAAAH